MKQIDLSNLDAKLIADLDGDTVGHTAWETDYKGVDAASRHWHIVHGTESERGGIVDTGSGSTASTYWFDARTPEEVLACHQAGEIVTMLTR